MGEQLKSPTEAFGEVLRELRAEKGLTQEGLALDAALSGVIFPLWKGLKKAHPSAQSFVSPEPLGYQQVKSLLGLRKNLARKSRRPIFSGNTA